MIVHPINDYGCLSQLHDQAREAAQSDDVRAFVAAHCPTLRDLVMHLRQLPQWDDGADEDEEYELPRIDCGGTPQRVRVCPPDPNCVERTLWYLAAAENIRPEIARSSATARTSAGLHTFPVELARGPVVLDPVFRGNELRAVVDSLSDEDVPLTSPERLLPWCFTVAQSASRTQSERQLVQATARELRNGLLGKLRKVRISPKSLRKIVKLVARESGLWPEGEKALRQLKRTLERAAGGQLDPFLAAFATSTLGPIAGPAAVQAMRHLRSTNPHLQRLKRLGQIDPLLAKHVAHGPKSNRK